MSVYVIDPLTDRRWTDFVDNHPDASLFHCTSWLEALRRTYNYVPIVLTTAASGDRLTDGIPFCGVKSWTGNRLISLPFSDHCDPLTDRQEATDAILAFLRQEISGGVWKVVELRPRRSTLSRHEQSGTVQAGQRFCLHTIDLTQACDVIEKRFHPSCVQRAIRRAEREGLEYSEGSSPGQLASFYRLLRMTRRRHGVPPQPFEWFQNLVAGFGDRLTIRLASRGGQPVAAIMTFTVRSTVVYKYGGSDAAYHKLGGMPFLFWRTIRDAKAAGLKEFDLGRSDFTQPGLVTFKDRLGGERSTLTYYRQLLGGVQPSTSRWAERAARWAFERLPDPALTVAGRILYKHLG